MAMDQGRAQQQMARVRSKAASDAAFRQELLSNPTAALSKELGAAIPANITIRVLEDSADTVHLVLPPARGTGRVLDAELEGVAGGDALLTNVPTHCPPYSTV